MPGRNGRNIGWFEGGRRVGWGATASMPEETPHENDGAALWTARDPRRYQKGMESWWTELDDAILACLAEEGPLAPAEIGRRLGLSEGAVVSLVNLLAQEGKVRICLVGALWTKRTCSFWCPSRGQAVTSEFRERVSDGTRVAVNWCTAFTPPEAIECARHCLDDDLGRLDLEPAAAA